jgi:O-antigen ligase
MKPQKKAGKKKANNISKGDFFYLLPSIIAIAVVPLIVYLKVIVPGGIQKDLWMEGDIVADFFSYYKYIVLMLATITGVFSLLIRKMNNDLIIKKTYTYIPLVAYAFFVVLSSILSQYKDIATIGFVDRHEGVYTLLAYVALAFITLNLINSEINIKYIINAFLISSVIIGLISLSQYLGHDFFSTSIGKRLILPPEYQSTADHLRFRFDKYMVYTTLYNPNYVGSYVVLALPACIGAFLYEKKVLKKIILGALAILLFVCLIGSRSMAGLIGLVAAGVISLLFFRRFITKNIKWIAIIAACALIVLFGINYLTGGGISQRINISKLTGSIAGPQQVAGEAYVEDIVLKDNTLQIVTDKNSILLKVNEGAVSFYGNNNEKLVPKRDQNTVTLENSEYSLYKFEITDDGYVACYIGSKVFKIKVWGNNIKPAGLRGQEIDKVIHPEKFGFERQESALTARGFIWSRTIPLLKDTIFVGHGPDTFPIFFPQEDIVGKLNAYGVTNIFVDKPHSIYLQIAMNTGVLSLLAFVALLLIYVISSLKLYFKRNITDYKDFIGVSIFCAICGYCVTGLANDSVISVAPVFWVLLGVGMACNFLTAKLPAKSGK